MYLLIEGFCETNDFRIMFACKTYGEAEEYLKAHGWKKMRAADNRRYLDDSWNRSIDCSLLYWQKGGLWESLNWNVKYSRIDWVPDLNDFQKATSLD